MAALTVDFRKHSGPTPADDMAAQIITDCGNLTLDFKQRGFCASPLFFQSLGPWFPNKIQNVLSSEKRTLDHWATVQLFFSLETSSEASNLGCFWRCLSMVTLDALTPASLLVKLSQVFKSALLDRILKLAVIPVACAHFPTQFLPVNFALNMLWYSTPWTATPFSNDPLRRGCQWSSSGPLPSQQCSPLLWFQRTRDAQNVYCMDGHLLKFKC